MAIVKLNRINSMNPWNLSQLFDDNNPFNMGWEDQIAVDVYETEDDVMVEAQMPGFKEEDIKVTVEGSTLTLRGEMHEEIEDNKKKYYRKEIRSQSFVRSIPLPTHVSSDKADAEFAHGILKLKLPKAEEAKPKEISIKKG